MSRLIEFHLRLPFPCSISHPHLSHLSHSLQQCHSRDFELTVSITPSPITSGAREILPTAPPLPVQFNSPTQSNSAVRNWHNGPIIIASDHASWNSMASSPSRHSTDEDTTLPPPHGASNTHLLRNLPIHPGRDLVLALKRHPQLSHVELLLSRHTPTHAKHYVVTQTTVQP